MFKKALKESLLRIFDLDKASYEMPSESQEQECIFIEIDSSKNTIKEGISLAKVMGKIKVFAEIDKLPYGYFSKCIQKASPADTLPFFFYAFEDSVGTFSDINERSLSFVYFFNSQYDPAMGTITSINLTEQT